jgi:hypothetical protein
MEPAAGDEGCRAYPVAGAITVVIAPRRLQHLVLLRSLLDPVCRRLLHKPSGRLLTFGTHPPHRHARESRHPELAPGWNRGRRARRLEPWAPTFAGATRRRQPEPSVG